MKLFEESFGLESFSVFPTLNTSNAFLNIPHDLSLAKIYNILKDHVNYVSYFSTFQVLNKIIDMGICLFFV